MAVNELIRVTQSLTQIETGAKLTGMTVVEAGTRAI